MKKKKKWLILLCIVLVIAAGTAALILTGVYDPDNTMTGNNANATGYGKGGLHDKEFKSVEDALQAVLEEEDVDPDKVKLLYQARTGDLEKVYLLRQDEVEGYEFQINGEEEYCYIGVRSAMFANFYETKTYSLEETVLADLSSSTSKGYKKLVNPRELYGVLPAWGISDSEKVRDMTVDGQSVDEVVGFSQDGETYYLWIIDDLKTENNAVDIRIELP